MRLTKRGWFVAGFIAGVIVTWLYATADANYQECIRRGYSVAQCSE